MPQSNSSSEFGRDAVAVALTIVPAILYTLPGVAFYAGTDIIDSSFKSALS